MLWEGSGANEGVVELERCPQPAVMRVCDSV
jgi:hypothetical protein